MMRRPRRSPLFPCTTLSRSPPPAVQMQAGLAPCTWAGSLIPEETSFAVFLDRIRSGDEQAAEELVRQYEPKAQQDTPVPQPPLHIRCSLPGPTQMLILVTIH